MPPALGPKMSSSLRPVSQHRSLNDQGITVTPAEPLGTPSPQSQGSRTPLSKQGLVKNRGIRSPVLNPTCNRGNPRFTPRFLSSWGASAFSPCFLVAAKPSLSPAPTRTEGSQEAGASPAAPPGARRSRPPAARKSGAWHNFSYGC